MNVSTSDWQISCNEIKQRGNYLFQSRQWSDCSFLVGTEPNQIVIKGHKLLLAMSSPVFEVMFYSELAEKNECIPIPDVQVVAFKALLAYIYTDKVNINSVYNASKLYYAAKKYMLPHLVEECTKNILTNLNPENACRIYEFAKLYEEPVLIDKSLKIMATQTQEVLNQSSFEDADINTVITLFEQNILNIQSELNLFEAAIRYAKAQPNNSQDAQPNPDPAEPTPPTQPEAEDSNNGAGENIDVESLGDQPALAGASSSSAVNLTPSTSQPVSMDTGVYNNPLDIPISKKRKIMDVTAVSQTPMQNISGNQNAPASGLSIRNAVTKIRFLTLTPQQFVDCPDKSSLLSPSETIAILLNISSANCEVPMPEGFSNSTEKRKPSINSSLLKSYLTTNSTIYIRCPKCYNEYLIHASYIC